MELCFYLGMTVLDDSTFNFAYLSALSVMYAHLAAHKQLEAIPTIIEAGIKE